MMDGARLLTAGYDGTVRLWNLDSAQVESDISDNTFTICPNTLVTTTIDVGSAPYGFRRDTTVAALIRNHGDQPLRVENIRITGDDSASFSLLPGITLLEIPAGGSATLTLRFTPAAARAHKAVMDMEVGDEHLELQIQGEGLAIPLVQLVDIVDLGTVETLKRKDTVTGPIMRNMSDRPVTIDTILVKPAYYVLSPVKDTVLSPGRTLAVRLIYYSPGVAARDSRNLLIVYRYQKQLDTLVIPIDIETIKPALVGNEGESDTGMDIYPNPSFDHLRIIIAPEMGRTCGIEIYDMSGMRLLKRIPDAGQRADGSVDLDVSSLPEGAYLLVVETSSRKRRGLLRIVR